MYILFEKSASGRISFISNRYSKANNKYLKCHAPKQEPEHIYLDLNNLYGYAMYKFLSKSGFKWIYFKEFDLNKDTSNSFKGCVVEVDLKYDYPLAPDKIEIKKEMLSNCQLKISDLFNISIGNIKRLAPIVFGTEKYLLHYENLQLYLRLELKLKKYIAY